MTRLKYFLIGAVAAAATGAYAGPSILAAIPLESCSDGANDALSTTSEVVFAANPQRKDVLITNNSSSIGIYVRRGATATAASAYVPPLGSWHDTIQGGYIYTGTIDAIAASGTPDISAEECK